MAKASVFSTISLYDEFGQVLEQVKCGTSTSADRTSAVITSQRDPSKLDKAALLHDINELLSRAELVQRPRTVREITTLRQDVEDGVPSDTDNGS